MNGDDIPRTDGAGPRACGFDPNFDRGRYRNQCRRRRHPRPIELGPEHEAFVADVARLRVRAQDQVVRFMSYGRPDGRRPGALTQRYIDRMAPFDRLSLRVLQGLVEPTADICRHLTALVDDLTADLTALEAADDVVDVGRMVRGGEAAAHVDVVCDGGRTWVVSGTWDGFGPDLSVARRMRAQGERLLRIAADEANHIDGRAPRVVFDLRTPASRNDDPDVGVEPGAPGERRR
ncbi:MAG: hypothetical protein ACFCVK_26205 [Acidimicrobiales bacterium]